MLSLPVPKPTCFKGNIVVNISLRSGGFDTPFSRTICQANRTAGEQATQPPTN